MLHDSHLINDVDNVLVFCFVIGLDQNDRAFLVVLFHPLDLIVGSGVRHNYLPGYPLVAVFSDLGKEVLVLFK